MAWEDFTFVTGQVKQPKTEEVTGVLAHRALQLGRLLMQNGAETEVVEQSVIRLASAFGGEAHVLINYETLLVTMVHGQAFRTKVGHRLPALTVNVAALDTLGHLVVEAEGHRLTLEEIGRALDELEDRPLEFNRWAVVAAIGVTAGSLARLFGGDWTTVGLALVTGAVAMAVRQEMGRRGVNVFLAVFAGALAAGLTGAAMMAMGWRADPVLALVAPGMILVPGVPLLNGVLDLFKNRMTVGLPRLVLGGAITFSIAVGLFLAASLTGRALPVAETSRSLAVLEDAFFSAVAAVGYVFLFNAPARLLAGCVACGLAGHALRTGLLHLGLDMVAGSFFGALAVGLMARIFAVRTGAPPVAFAFPGVVAMIPGAFAFRAVSGCLQWVRLQSETPVPVLAETLSLAVTALLMVLAIALGIALPEVLGRRRE